LFLSSLVVVLVHALVLLVHAFAVEEKTVAVVAVLTSF
jgi:hypothetical protein